MRASRRSGGLAVGKAALAVLAVLVLTARPADRLSAQRVAIGPQVLFGDYREVSGDLRYKGVGFGAAAGFAWGKFGAEAVYGRISYDPDVPTAVQSFTATQLDGRVRYHLSGPVSLEAGVTRRTMDPEFAAQSMGAARVGVRMSQLVGAGTRLVLRGNYLAAAKFTGGGTASFAIDVGLGVSSEFAKGHLRVSADYDFQRIDRKTNDGSGDEDVPIQQALVRIGIGVQF